MGGEEGATHHRRGRARAARIHAGPRRPPPAKRGTASRAPWARGSDARGRRARGSGERRASAPGARALRPSSGTTKRRLRPEGLQPCAPFCPVGDGCVPARDVRAGTELATGDEDGRGRRRPLLLRPCGPSAPGSNAPPAREARAPRLGLAVIGHRHGLDGRGPGGGADRSDLLDSWRGQRADRRGEPTRRAPFPSAGDRSPNARSTPRPHPCPFPLLCSSPPHLPTWPPARPPPRSPRGLCPPHRHSARAGASDRGSAGCNGRSAVRMPRIAHAGRGGLAGATRGGARS